MRLGVSARGPFAAYVLLAAALLGPEVAGAPKTEAKGPGPGAKGAPPGRAEAGLSLESALERLDRVTLHRARLRAVRELYGAEEEQSETWDNPIIQGNVGRIDLPSESGAIFDLTVEQRLPVKGLRELHRRRARERRDGAEEDETTRALRERVAVIRLLYELASEVAHNNHVRERLERLQSLRTFLRSRPLASPARRVEAYLIQSRLDALERKLRQGQRELDSRWAELEAYLQWQKRPPLAIQWFRGGPKLEREFVLGRARAASPELRAQKRAVREAELAVSAADAERFPAPMLRAYFGGQRTPVPENYYGVGVAIALPFSARARLEKQRALAAANMRRLELREKERHFTGRLAAALARYENDARAVTEQPLEMHEQSDRQVAYALAEFRRGRVDPSAVLDLDDRSDELHEAVYGAQLRLVHSYTELMLLSGEPKFGLSEWRLPAETGKAP